MARIQSRSRLEWRKDNPTLAKGELGHEVNSNGIKIGDGVTRWSDLPFTMDADRTNAGLNSTALRVPSDWGSAWRSAITNNDLARVAVVGDSVGRGFYSSDLNRTGWAALLRETLQSNGRDGGSGFRGVVDTPAAVGVVEKYTENDSFWDMTGGWALYRGPGPSATSIHTSEPGASITTTLRGTDLTVIALADASFSRFDYKIDAGPWVPGPTWVAYGVEEFKLPTQSAGTHTLSIRYPPSGTSGPLYLIGASARNQTGIVVDNYSTSGGWSGLFENQDDTKAGAWSGGWKRPADLVIYAMGLNDASVGISDPSNTVLAAQRYLDGVRNNGGGVYNRTGQTDVILLVNHCGRFDPLGDYYRRAQGLIHLADLYGAAIVNIWGDGRNSYKAWADLGYWADESNPGSPGSSGVHPSDSGHAHIHDLLMSMVPSLL